MKSKTTVDFPKHSHKMASSNGAPFKMERKSSFRRFYRTDSQADLTKFWDGGEHFAMQNR